MVELSSLEILLTKPIRNLISHYLKVTNQEYLKKYAFLISLLSCICSGTVILYSLWTPYFTQKLHYSQFEINIIGGSSSMGMYLLLPIIGNLADIYGTVLLSLISVITFVPSYFIAALVFENDGNFWLMAICFALIGLGTSSLYFASLLTCAKMYPNIKGLSISLPVTCYGLSSLISSKLIQNIYWFHINSDDDLNFDISKIFKFFGFMYFIIGLFNYSSSCILTIEKQFEFIKSSDDNNEDAPLLSSSITSYNSIDNDEMITEIDSINEISHDKKFKYFLKDPSTYLFLISFFFCIGPLEMYINNMGSLVVLINKLSFQNNPISIPNQVSYHSFFSTIIRLVIGGLSDYLTKSGICRIWLLLIILLIGIIDQGLISYLLYSFNDESIKDSNNFYNLISCFAGLSYGGIFTIYPTIMANIWGLDILGSTWGSFMIAPAFSSLIFGLVYANIYDYFNDYKVYLVFILTGFSILVSTLITTLTWKCIWSKRGFDIF